MLFTIIFSFGLLVMLEIWIKNVRYAYTVKRNAWKCLENSCLIGLSVDSLKNPFTPKELKVSDTVKKWVFEDDVWFRLMFGDL